MKKYVPLLIAMVLLLLSAEVFAKSLVSISMKAEKEVMVNKEKKMVAAEEINSGDMIFFTLSYVNSGDDAATNAVLDDPIPQGTTYITGSAFGKAAEITFSIDGGKTFKKPSLLSYEFKLPSGKIEKRSVSPEEYTHVRWTFKIIPARGSGQVGFQVKMK